MTSERKTLFSSSLLIFVLTALLGCLIYSNTLKASFHFDDMATLVYNDVLKDLGNWRVIWNAFNTRFVLAMTLAMNFALHGLNVTGFHVFNITNHLLSSFLVYWLVRLSFQTPVMKENSLGREAELIGWGASLLFLVHPVQTQAVNYIWQRGASLATFFYLSAMVFYVKGRLSERPWHFLIAFFATLLGMFTKEITFTIPLMMAICELTFFGPDKKTMGRRWLILLPFLVLLFVIPLMLLRSPQVTLNLMQPDVLREQPLLSGVTDQSWDITRWVGESEMPRKDYYLTQLPVVRTYLRLLFFPVNQNLDYDYPISQRLAEPATFFSLVLLGMILLGVMALFKKYRLASFGILWFFIALSVESSAVQKDVIYEHRLYLPMAGFAIFSAAGLHAVLKRRRDFLIILLVMASIFSVATYRRNRVWKSELTLWRDVTRKSPHKARGFNQLALAYGDRRNYRHAILCYKKAIEINPEFDSAYLNLGTAYAARGKHKKAIYYYQKTTELNPKSISAYNNLGISYSTLRRYEEGEKYFNQAIEKAALYDPKQVEPISNLGVLYVMLGKREEALELFKKAIRINPNDEKAYLRLAELYKILGKNEEAEALMKSLQRHGDHVH